PGREAERTEHSGRASNRPSGSQRPANLGIDRANINHRNVRVQPPYLLAHRVHKLPWIETSPQVIGHKPKAVRLEVWKVHLGRSGVAQILELDIFHDSDYFPIGRIRG